MADTWFGEADLKLKRVDLGDGTYAEAVAAYDVGSTGAGSGASIKLPLTVQAAAYAGNDLVGGKLAFTGAALTSGGSRYLRGIVMTDLANPQNSAPSSIYDLLLFDADPTGTTFTENGPLSVGAADVAKIIGVIQFDPTAAAPAPAVRFVFPGTGTNPSTAVLYRPLAVPIKLTGVTTLYGALIARGTPTYSGTGNVAITLLLDES